MPGTRKLGRVTAHRKAMLRGQVTALLQNGQLQTTYWRAKELSAIADEMITLGKKGGLNAYREALKVITVEDVAKKLFDTIAPAYAKTAGGYTQVYKLGPRRGDAAEMALIKLVDVKKEEEPVVEEKPAKKTTRKKAAPKAEGEEAAAPKKRTTKKAAAVTEAPVEAPATEAPAAEEAPATEAAE